MESAKGDQSKSSSLFFVLYFFLAFLLALSHQRICSSRSLNAVTKIGYVHKARNHECFALWIYPVQKMWPFCLNGP